jgi:hypothetical protein
MRDFSTPRTFILSAYQGINPADDFRAHADLSFDLAYAGIPFRECEGSYKGAREQSFVVVGVENQFAVETLARKYEQVSFLLIAENDRLAYDVSTETGYHEHLGKFTVAGDEEPACDAWTLVDGVYFTCDGRPGTDLPGGL